MGEKVNNKIHPKIIRKLFFLSAPLLFFRKKLIKIFFDREYRHGSLSRCSSISTKTIFAVIYLECSFCQHVDFDATNMLQCFIIHKFLRSSINYGVEFTHSSHFKNFIHYAYVGKPLSTLFSPF